MIDRKVIELSNQVPEQPELEILLDGCATDAERKAVREAFYTFAQGDPGGFSVQFAVLLQAHARVLKCAPERLRKALSTELTPITQVIISNRSALEGSARSIAKDATDIHDQVSLLSEFNQELRELIIKMRESEAAARETFLRQIDREISAIQDATQSILFISKRWILLAVFAVYLIGIASHQFLAGLFTWLEKIL
jgi:hypothetical protein